MERALILSVVNVNIDGKSNENVQNEQQNTQPAQTFHVFAIIDTHLLEVKYTMAFQQKHQEI